MLQKQIVLICIRHLKGKKSNLLFTDIIRIEAKFSFPCQIDITTFYLVQTGIS